MSAFGGDKRHPNARNKLQKKLPKRSISEHQQKFENITISDNECQSLNTLDITKKLDLKDIDTESEDILFPYELNKNLQEKVEGLIEENGALQRLLEESEARLKALEVKCPPAVHGRASDLAASKIVELSKKIRELTAELEVTKLRVRNYENEPQQKKNKVEVLPEEKEIKTDSALLQELKDVTEKLNAANLKLCESRNQIQQLKHELKMTQKALTDEVGQNVSVQSIISGKGWRGRAQQICGLQQRLNQLTEKLSNLEQGNTPVSNDSVASMRQVEKDIRLELTNELKDCKKELDQMKSKWSAAKARCSVLEHDLSSAKERISTLLLKTSHDDQLISVLTAQINSITEKFKEEKQAIVKKLEQNISNLENCLATEKVRSKQLQSILDSREEQICELQEKVKSLQRTNSENGEKLQNNDNNKNCLFSNANNSEMINNQETFGQVAEVERVRLVELIRVLNKRLDDQRMNSLQIEEELRVERHKSAKLETKVARLELERVGADKSLPMYSNSNRYQSADNSSTEKAKEKIELLEERCAALKSRLQCITQEKEDDIYHLSCLLDEAKKAFTEASKKANQ